MSGLGVWHSLAVDGAAAVSSSRSFHPPPPRLSLNSVLAGGRSVATLISVTWATRRAG